MVCVLYLISVCYVCGASIITKIPKRQKKHYNKILFVYVFGVLRVWSLLTLSLFVFVCCM